jgi:hypothetical protein
MPAHQLAGPASKGEGIVAVTRNLAREITRGRGRYGSGSRRVEDRQGRALDRVVLLMAPKCGGRRRCGRDSYQGRAPVIIVAVRCRCRGRGWKVLRLLAQRPGAGLLLMRHRGWIAFGGLDVVAAGRRRLGGEWAVRQQDESACQGLHQGGGAADHGGVTMWINGLCDRSARCRARQEKSRGLSTFFSGGAEALSPGGPNRGPLGCIMLWGGGFGGREHGGYGQHGRDGPRRR